MKVYRWWRLYDRVDGACSVPDAMVDSIASSAPYYIALERLKVPVRDAVRFEVGQIIERSLGVLDWDGS